jgi:anthranilate phosphoribosyltransferase
MIRKELGVRTIFNILGPLINPAQPRGIVAGVYEKRLGPIMIEAFKLTGMKKAIVVHGANGLDEVRFIKHDESILVSIYIYINIYHVYRYPPKARRL